MISHRLHGRLLLTFLLAIFLSLPGCPPKRKISDNTWYRDNDIALKKLPEGFTSMFSSKFPEREMKSASAIYFNHVVQEFVVISTSPGYMYRTRFNGPDFANVHDEKIYLFDELNE